MGTKKYDPWDWYIFKNEVLTTSRYVLSEEAKKFLQEVLNLAKKNVRHFEKGSIFYRARVGHQEQKTIRDQILPLEPFSGEDMGIPPFSKKAVGRANPHGIKCLYLATDEQTAVAEVRPYKGGFVSIVCFSVKESMDLIDFSSPGFKGFFFSAGGAFALGRMEGVDQGAIEKVILGLINYDFSKPVRHEDQVIDYIPTQILAEHIKRDGFKGIIYNSSLSWSNGDNVALFDDCWVEQDLTSAKLVEIEKITMEIKDYEWDAGKRIKSIMKDMH
ncbi:MAG: RES family NAD+ phosphorylase [Candidatus Omnitrophica bacterium]|nr:RES family NAD+ phosphorylase [Candidatus Omnitrophota bacterium]